MTGRSLKHLGLAVALTALAPVGAFGSEPTSCTICHSDPDLFDEPAVAMVASSHADAHGAVGLSCHDCHGGNPAADLADDLDAAMDEGHAANPYRGVPTRDRIPEFCGGCHSDPAYMKRFRPDARVDQEIEYRSSRHGELLATGDLEVATCTDCHGVHQILPPDDTRSQVHPTRVADMCAGCHSDADRMSGRHLPDGRPLPIDQHARWQLSVHAAALFDREDLTAPTCNDCHGNHGAAPPGLESIGYVCGQCHGREAELFRASAKHEAYELHREFLADGGTDGCASCHESPEPAAEFRRSDPFSECSTCHGNHAVIRPSLAMFEGLPETPCAFCHEGTGPLADSMAEAERVTRSYEATLDRLLAAAHEAGLAGEELFDHMIDETLALPAHGLGVSDGAEGAQILRPEFDLLFQKFRIGKTHFYYDDPVTGAPVREPIIRCGDCHAEEPILADSPLGLEASRYFVSKFRELTSATARADRILLAARRGGVETRDALAEIEQSVDAQIALEVLVHTFSTNADDPFATKQEEGLEHAEAALTAGRRALDELAFRRKGLAVSLIIILALLVALGLKIRELSAAAHR